MALKIIIYNPATLHNTDQMLKQKALEGPQKTLDGQLKAVDQETTVNPQGVTRYEVTRRGFHKCLITTETNRHPECHN